MDQDRLRRLVAQHAETSRLMGVDFVPSYRTGGAIGILEPKEIGPAPAPLPVAGGGALFRPDGPAPAPSPARAVAPALAPRDPAASQRRLDELKERYEREAPHKQFVTGHTRIVFGEGDPCARLMFIGEAPGEEEDRTGRPFVGRAGQLLDRMITAMGLKREQVYIANVLKTRPPNNATPTTEEARLCAPYLFEQIGIVGPEVIVTLGLPATRLILDSMESMGRLRSRWGLFRDPSGREIPVMPTYHPAYLLRNYTPQERAKVWSDLQLVMQRLGLTGAMKTTE